MGDRCNSLLIFVCIWTHEMLNSFNSILCSIGDLIMMPYSRTVVHMQMASVIPEILLEFFRNLSVFLFTWHQHSKNSFQFSKLNTMGLGKHFTFSLTRFIFLLKQLSEFKVHLHFHFYSSILPTLKTFLVKTNLRNLLINMN